MIVTFRRAPPHIGWPRLHFRERIRPEFVIGHRRLTAIREAVRLAWPPASFALGAFACSRLPCCATCWGRVRRPARDYRQRAHRSRRAGEAARRRTPAFERPPTSCAPPCTPTRRPLSLSNMDARITKEVSDALAENNRRRAAVAAGTVRVRYIAARCPSPDLPTPPPPAAGDGAGVELASSGWFDVLDLREALIATAPDRMPQATSRKITEPVGLGLKGMMPAGRMTP